MKTERKVILAHEMCLPTFCSFLCLCLLFFCFFKERNKSEEGAQPSVLSQLFQQHVWLISEALISPWMLQRRFSHEEEAEEEKVEEKASRS